jgi:hypothetical protein
MKKLLLTSALTVAGLGFASGAMAQVISDDTITESTELSLLERILAGQAQLQASLLNAAENYANLDGSINIDVNMDGLLTAIALGTSESGDIDATGFLKSVSYTDAAIALSYYDPSSMKSSLGNLSTTVIGALGTGTIGQTTSGSTADGTTGNTTSSSNTLSGVTLALLDVSSNAQAITESSQAYSTKMVDDPGLVQVANIAGNYAQDLNGSITLAFADSLVAGGNMSTTVIGSLGTGNIAASLQRNLIGTSGVAGSN